jgi:hypothetical protein
MKLSSDKLIILLIGLMVIYLIYKKYNNDEIEKFAVCNIEYDYIGNPLMKRDGSNLLYDPALDSGKEPKNVLLGFSDSSGWSGTDGQTLTVRFNKLMDLRSLIIKGGGKFKIKVEMRDPNTQSKVWRNLQDDQVPDAEQKFIFNGGGATPSHCFNLAVEDSTNIVCQAIKFIVQGTSTNAQFEVLGIESDSSPGYQFTSDLNNYAKLYNENNVEVPKTGDNMLTWSAEPGNTDPKFTIKFEESDSIPIANKIISFVEIKANNNSWLTSYNIAYKYKGSNVTRHIMDIPGNTGSGNVSLSRYYFKYPLLANEIVIKPSSSTSVSSPNDLAGCLIKLFGKTIENESQESVLKSEQETFYKITGSKNKKETCPPINTLINKQAEIQQLCDALEQTDEIEFEKKKIDTNKMYQLKLSKQRKEIQSLQDKIKDMRDANKFFDEVEDRNKMATYQYQANMDKKLKELVKQRLEKQVGLNLNMAVKEPVAEGNNTVESFSNPSTTRLSNRFSHNNLSMPSENFYEEFVGSHYFN